MENKIPVKQPGKRQLTVYPKHFERYYSTIVLPEIRLCGIWLHQLGFTEGKTVTIETERNKIVITLNNDGNEATTEIPPYTIHKRGLFGSYKIK